MDQTKADIKKALDKVVGEEFAPKTPWRTRLARWAAGACLALAAVAVIMTILHTHLMQAQTAPAPPKPVGIQIVPSR